MQENNISQSNGKVLVIGGGVGGIRTALDLAEAGRDVVLIEKSYSIGGLMTLLDRTFPTNNCDLCTLSPHLSESGRDLHIELLTMTQLSKLEGSAGKFTVTLTTEPRYIDLEKCTACGDCQRAFPESVRFTPGLDHRAPTCMRYPQATPYAFSIDMTKCESPEDLVKVCRAGAINTQDTQKVQRLEVGSVVLAPGAEIFDPTVMDTYGYGVFPDVVTSLEYERILSASGPTKGELVRPSDGRPPKKIAWIQCVGSRSVKEGAYSYCSGACCMFALKEATVTRERFHDDIETTIFFMDMRTSWKDYELYYQRAKNNYGVRLVRSRPHSVSTNPETGCLSIDYVPTDGSLPKSELFDMVVLSTGFRVTNEMRELAANMGIELNEHSFAKTSSFNPVSTSKPGIYVCGLFESPKDIPETMVQASAAAFNASRHVEAYGKLPESDDELPPERDITGEEPRIGVFVCDCGFDIGGIIDVGKVLEAARFLPGVKATEMVGHGCSRESMEHIQDVIRKKNLNRVVIGGCSPRTHETLFQDNIRKAGLNKFLLEIANLRDQDAWVHKGAPGEATKKAMELIRMAVGSVRLAHPLADNTLPMNKDVLVVGGGVTGMNAALNLADMGFKVYLVEKSGKLGGVAKFVRKNIAGDDIQAYMNDLIDIVQQHKRIEVLTNSVVVDHSGMAGMFKTGLQIGPQMYYRSINHGVTILATGALPNLPSEYLLGKHNAVVTQLALDALLEDKPEMVKSWRSIAMIQCVGSRSPENPNCSRICCESAVKNALRILDLNPEAQIYILYRDMRTPGFLEDYYRKARERGVIFVRYEAEGKPQVEATGEQVRVTFNDPILHRDIVIPADCLALSTGLIADEEDTEELGMIFRLPRTSDHYFLEDHVKLRPVDLPVPGFFVAGAAHAPKNIRDSIAQAQAATGRAQTFLAREGISLGAVVAQVDGNKCAACLICVRACPFGVPFINSEGYSQIDAAKCHGCGVCAAECPAKAIQLMQYEDDQLSAKIDALFDGLSERIA
jgi:heterodisulfide reductase subunit A